MRRELEQKIGISSPHRPQTFANTCLQQTNVGTILRSGPNIGWALPKLTAQVWGPVELTQLFQIVPNIFRSVPTCSDLSHHFQMLPNVFRLFPTFSDSFQHFQFVFSQYFQILPIPLPCWDQKMTLGSVDRLDEHVVYFHDFWTLVK